MGSLRPSINRLVTDGNTKLCGQGFVLVIFQSMTANKIPKIIIMKFFPVCKVK